MSIEVKTFFDKRTFTLTYVVFDPKTKDAIIIDPVWDFDSVSSKMSTKSVSQVVEYIQSKSLVLHYILETHAHADHISGAQLIKKAYPDAKIAIGERIKTVQETFKPIFGFGEEFKTDGSQFDLLLKENQTINAGSIGIETIFTPGHTPACSSYKIDDSIFTGDAMFMPDSGTGRCDFPKGNAKDLYNSITDKLYKLPDTTKVYVGHDYQPGGRELKFQTTIGEQKESNIQLPADRNESDFIKFRSERDASLSLPKLIFQSVQVNINGAKFVTKSENTGFLRIPVTLR